MMQRYAWSDDEEDYDNVGVGVAVAGAVSPGFSDEEGEEPAVKQRCDAMVLARALRGG